VGPAVSALEVGDPAFGARAGSQLVCRREIMHALGRGVEVIDEIFGLEILSKFAARLSRSYGVSE